MGDEDFGSKYWMGLARRHKEGRDEWNFQTCGEIKVVRSGDPERAVTVLKVCLVHTKLRGLELQSRPRNMTRIRNGGLKAMMLSIEGIRRHGEKPCKVLFPLFLPAA